MSAIKLFRIIRLKSHPMSIIRKKSHNSSHFGQCTTSQIDSSSKDPGTLGFEKERFFILKFTLVFFYLFSLVFDVSAPAVSLKLIISLYYHV